MSLSVDQMHVLSAVSEDPWLSVLPAYDARRLDEVVQTLCSRGIVFSGDGGASHRPTPYGLSMLALYRHEVPHVW